MYKKSIYLLLTICILFSACAKEEQTADSTKQLLSFQFKEVDATRTSVQIVDDSVLISVPHNADLAALTPLLEFKGVRIEPLSGVTKDFSTVKTFTVTAGDSTKKTYHVCVHRRDAVFIGGLVQLLALDSKDGSLLWKDSTNQNFAYSNPLLVGDILYAGNISGYMCAFNARNGKAIWQTFLSAIGIESSATVNGNTLYVGDNDDYMVALNAATGAVKWQFKTGANVSTKPLIFRNMVIFGSSDSYVYALDTTNGNVVWKYSTGDMIGASSPVLSNGVIFIGSRSNQLFAIDAATGTRKWAYNTGISMEQSIPVVWNGTVYAPGWYDVSNFNLKGSLYALNEQTGTLKWQALDSLGFTGPLATAAGLLYLPADDGNFYAVNASTGATVWSSLILPNGAGAAIKNGVAYVGGGGTRNVYALDALTGAIIWTYPIPNDLMTSDPAVGREKKHKGVSISL